MVKKILFILCLTLSTLVFSQKKSLSDLAAAPNPFTTSTKITYTSDNEEDVTLIIKNVLGKLMYKKVYKSTLGENTITFLKDDLKSGIYFYQIQNATALISKRFVIK